MSMNSMKRLGLAVAMIAPPLFGVAYYGLFKMNGSGRWLVADAMLAMPFLIGHLLFLRSLDITIKQTFKDIGIHFKKIFEDKYNMIFGISGIIVLGSAMIGCILYSLIIINGEDRSLIPDMIVGLSVMSILHMWIRIHWMTCDPDAPRLRITWTA